MFDENPETLIEETNSLVVCPSCLAEKPIEQTLEINYQGKKLNLYDRFPGRFGILYKTFIW